MEQQHRRRWLFGALIITLALGIGVLIEKGWSGQGMRLKPMRNSRPFRRS